MTIKKYIKTGLRNKKYISVGFDLFNQELDFVLKYRNRRGFDEENNCYKVGVWFKKSKCVRDYMLGHPDKWHSNLVSFYMFGFDLGKIQGWLAYRGN